jgi:DNA mismatch repair protein MutS
MLAFNIAEELPPNPLLEALDDIDPDEMSPRNALDKLYALKKLTRE